MRHVLLVEHDPTILHLLQAAIALDGFTSSQALSAAEALDKIAADRIDAVLLFPDFAGPQLIKLIRAASDVPIIVVSGQSDEPTRIAALDAGADDFVENPYMPAELLARLRAVLRRYHPDHRVADAEAPADAGEEARRQSPKRRPMGMKLIDLLRARPNQLVPSQEIISVVWGNGSGRSGRNLRVLVTSVRHQLVAEGAPYEIVNEHGRGYRLMPAERSESPDRLAVGD
jgi:two-component system KDP operon response regulator KdpE